MGSGMMDKLSQLWRRLLFYLRRDRFDRELEEEMRFHLEMKVEENLAAGRSPDEARYAAQRQFGNQTLLREGSRDMWAVRSIETLFQDLRYGARTLLKNPGFTAVAVLTLALGIGANTAIFSVINAVLLQPLPYPDSGRLAMVWQKYTKRGWGLVQVSYPNFAAIREQSQVFENVAATSYDWFNLTADGGPPERLIGMRVSASLFGVLAVSPLIGRPIMEEDMTGEQRVVILSHGLWQRRFGSNAGITENSITLNGEVYTVVGVMPPEFQYPPPFTVTMLSMPITWPKADLWVPLARDASQKFPGHRNLHLIGRLKPGVSPEQAQVEMNTIGARLEQQYPGYNTGMELSLTTLYEQVVGSVRQALWVLFGVVGFILLIACSNVASMLLARVSGRRKELGVRLAVGASRLRLIRQLLTEFVMLATVGGALGLLLAYLGCKLLIAVNPDKLPRTAEIELNWYALGFTAAVTLLTGIIFGLIPAFTASKLDLTESLKEEGRSAGGGISGGKSRRLLVVAEVALSLVLLIGAGLMIRSLVRMLAIDPGFKPERLLTLRLSLSSADYDDRQRQIGFYQQLMQRIERLPGVEAVAAINTLPMNGDIGNSSFNIEGRPSLQTRLNNEQPTNAAHRVVSHDYFRMLGIPLERGRTFTAGDAAGTQGVAIINRTAARVFWPNEDPLGKRVGPSGVPNWLTIVGVIEDVRHAALGVEPQAEIYWTYPQYPARRIDLLIRTTTDPLSLAGVVRNEIWAIDKTLPISDVRTMDELLSASVALPRFYSLLLTIFAAVALLLATVGIYGVISYAINQRTHEIGIRMALGACPRDVLSMIISQGMKLVLAGIGIGLVGALALTRLMKNLLFGVSATDPLTFIVIALILAFVALLACWIPARRAAKVDPITALRFE
jgi:predicted permease